MDIAALDTGGGTDRNPTKTTETQEAEPHPRAQAQGPPQQDQEDIDLVVFCPCDGISAVTHALKHHLQLQVRSYIMEILPEALRVTRSRLPNNVELGDLTTITDDQLETVARSAHKCGHILYTAGTPCQDNSELKGHTRQGLEGPKSSLLCSQT